MTWFLWALGSAIASGMSALLEKNTLEHERTGIFAFLLALVTAVFSVPFLVRADFQGITPQVMLLIACASLFGAAGFFFGVRSMKHIALSETAALFALSPLFATLCAFVLFGERLAWMQFGGLFLMVAGIFFIEMPNWRTMSGIFRKGRGEYIVTIIAALFLMSIAEMFDRLIVGYYAITPITYLAIAQIFVACNISIFLAISPVSRNDLIAGIRIGWRIILLVGVLIFAQRYFYMEAVSSAASIGLVVAVRRLSAFFTIFFAGRIFHDDRIVQKMFATAVILCGALLLV